jgi:microcystin-dependent protein
MEPYIGEIRLFAGTFAPKGWLLCDGTYYDINRYQNLYSIITEIYGGDGHSKFAVPDLRGRAPIQWGKGDDLATGYEIGKKAGAQTVNLSVGQLPAHNHSINAKTLGDKPTPAGNFMAGLPTDPTTGQGTNDWAGTMDVLLNPSSITPTGNNQPVNIVSPILAVTYIIAFEGVYPSRP